MAPAAGQNGALGLLTLAREYSSGLHLLTRSHHSCEWIGESLVLINYFLPKGFSLYVQVYVCAGVCVGNLCSLNNDLWETLSAGLNSLFVLREYSSRCQTNLLSLNSFERVP